MVPKVRWNKIECKTASKEGLLDVAAPLSSASFGSLASPVPTSEDVLDQRPLNPQGKSE
jgi:hypothetical protein